MEELKPGIDRKTYRLREESMARKRNQEYHKQLFWNDITNYYKTWNVQASKYNLWASQSPSPVSGEREKELESMSLEQRRTKLAKLLADEDELYAKEMQDYRLREKNAKRELMATSCGNVEYDNLGLILQEEENSRRSRAAHKYDQRKSVHPVIQMIEKKKCQESMKKSWTEQMKEKKMREESEKEMARRLEEETERRRKIEEERERELVCQRQEEMKHLRNYLLTQMEEVKRKDELTRQLKVQEQREIKLKTELEDIASRRNQIERQRRTKEFRSFLRHQYQSQLKQKTRQIQEELNEDRRLIDDITRCLEQEEKENNRLREETRKEIDRANAMLAEYTKLEKQREREMEFMFFEEARKMWQKQESYWEAEKEARNKLMRDVLLTIQKQVKENLQRSAEQHKSLLEEKEDLLKKIEDANKQLKERERETAEKKKEYMMDLQEQMKEKEVQRECQKHMEEKEFRDQQVKLMQEEERILSELRKMTTTSKR